MTTTKTPSSIDRATSFLESLHRRITHDNGAKAALKRAISGEQRHLYDVYSLTLPYLAGIPNRQQDLWIFIASLSVYYPQTSRATEEERNFGQSCKRLASTTNSEGAERRFRALLETSLTDINSPLTALVRLMKSKEVRIDYPRLLVDLCQWEHSDQYIQDRWARTFWSNEP